MSSERNNEREPIYLMSLRMGSEETCPLVHFLYLCTCRYRGEDIPDGAVVDRQGRILLTHSSSLIPALLEHAAARFRRYAQSINEEHFEFDVPRIMRTVLRGGRDSGGNVITFLHTIRDCVETVRLDPPSRYERALRKLCMHLTFHPEIDAFYARSRFSKDVVMEAIVWHMGTIFLNARFLVL